MSPETKPPVELCVNLCETMGRDSSPADLEEAVGSACSEAGFPYCERVYVGSYFCENYFCWTGEAFHESVQALCERHDMRATLVVPIAGQAFLARVQKRLDDTLTRFAGLYDEVVVNDVACFLDVQDRCDVRMGLGRLFSKEMRDARIRALMGRCATPALSEEALSCLRALRDDAPAPVIEFDPVAEVVDVSGVSNAAPNARIAMHLPYCFATTGRNCGPASIDERPDEKFRLGRGCSQHCLRMSQGYLTDGGSCYVKHGRTFFFENPACAIAGAPSWRIVYQAGLQRVM